jgi:ADP-ribosylglycohydrolase
MSNAMSLRSAAALGYFDKEDDAAHAARTMMFTHRETTALDGGEFFTRVAFRIIQKGLTPREAIEEVAKTSSNFIKQKVKQALDKVEEALNPQKTLGTQEFCDDLALTSMARLWEVGKTEPIKVGKASPTEGTLPGSVYLIVKHNDFYKAAKANAEIGGDSASRSVAIGMVLGAWQGLEGIPQRLKDTLIGYDKYDKLLNQLPLIKNESPDKSEL